MKNRGLPSNKQCPRRNFFAAAALIAVITVNAAAVFCSPGTGLLVLEDPKEKTSYAEYEMAVGDVFSITFVHSVNKSPVTDFFEVREDGIYGIKSVYYNFGAGVTTTLEEGQTLTYGEDGSMIISGLDVKMNDLIYRVGTVSDHVLTLPDSTEVSLRELCGRNARVGFTFRADEEG